MGFSNKKHIDFLDIKLGNSSVHVQSNVDLDFKKKDFGLDEKKTRAEVKLVKRF
jgi:hypothetical protein